MRSSLQVLQTLTERLSTMTCTCTHDQQTGDDSSLCPYCTLAGGLNEIGVEIREVDKANPKSDLNTILLSRCQSDFVRACKFWYGENGIQLVYEHYYGHPYEGNQDSVARILVEIIYDFNLIKNKHDFLQFVADSFHPPQWRLVQKKSIETFINTLKATIANWQMSGRRDLKEYLLTEINEGLQGKAGGL